MANAYCDFALLWSALHRAGTAKRDLRKWYAARAGGDAEEDDDDDVFACVTALARSFRACSTSAATDSFHFFVSSVRMSLS